MTEMDHMAAGRACLDCGGSPTRDFKYGCEHRYLATEGVEPGVRCRDTAAASAALSEAILSVQAAGRYDFDAAMVHAHECGDLVAITGIEQCFVAHGHGVEADAPTREAAVALWHRRAREVGEALVAFFERVHHLRPRSSWEDQADTRNHDRSSAANRPLPRASAGFVTRWSCSAGDFEADSRAMIAMCVEAIEQQRGDGLEAEADRALCILGDFVERGLRLTGRVETGFGDRWDLSVSGGDPSIVGMGTNAIGAVLALKLRLDRAATEAPDWWAAHPDDGGPVSAVRLRLKGEWLRDRAGMRIDRYAAALAFARAHKVGCISVRDGWTAILGDASKVADGPTVLEAIEALREATDYVTVRKGTSCGPSTPPVIEMLPPQSHLAPSEAEALHQRIERHNDAIAARAILPRNVIIAGIAGPDTHGQPVGYMEPPDPDAPTEVTLPRACYGLTAPATCEGCLGKATLLLTSPGSSRVLCEACAGAGS